MDEMTLTLSSPITEEQFDAITDVDFDNTDRIWFHTKNGKDVEFVKRKKGEWIDGRCSICGCDIPAYIIDWKWQKDMDANYCPMCGAYMRGDDHDL